MAKSVMLPEINTLSVKKEVRRISQVTARKALILTKNNRTRTKKIKSKRKELLRVKTRLKMTKLTTTRCLRISRLAIIS